jgi:VWFA-related protein
MKWSEGVSCVLLSTALALRADLRFQQPPVFRSSVEVTRVDVSVLDHDRRPIRDLTRDDFTILVDGVVQPIVAFIPVVLPAAEPPTTPWMREVAPDVTTNGFGDPRLFVIVMDDFNTPPDPFEVQTGKQIARAVVDQLGDGDLAAVLFTMARSAGQELTRDRTRLLQAIEHFNIGFVGSPVGGTSLYRTVADAYASLRDRPHNRSAILLIGGVGTGGIAKRLRESEEKGFDLADPLTEISALSTEARLARVPIYWFSTAGLQAPRFTTGGMALGGFDDAISRDLAAATGGRAIADTNAPADSVAAVLAENSVYYVIGYRPTYPAADGRLRRLHIAVTRPGATVFPDNRVMWSAKSTPRKAKALPPSRLFTALADIVPQSDIPLRVSVAPIAIPAGERGGGRTAAVALCIGIRRPSPDAPLRERVEIQGRLVTMNAQTVALTQQEATVALVPGTGEVEYEVLSRLDARPGRYQLRISVHSATLDTTGSVYADVTVPDFAKPPLSISGVVISAEPSPRSAPRDALVPLLSVIPTTKREFTASDRAMAFVRVYQGGKRPLARVAIRVRIADARGDEVLSMVDRLYPEQFGSRRAADYTFQLPLATLAEGPHLLMITVSMSPAVSARADVRFRMR